MIDWRIYLLSSGVSPSDFVYYVSPPKTIFGFVFGGLPVYLPGATGFVHLVAPRCLSMYRLAYLSFPGPSLVINRTLTGGGR